MFPVWWAHCGHQFGVTICRPPIDKLKDYLPGFTLVIMSLARSAQERLVGWKTIKEGSRVIGEQRIRVPVFEPVPWSSNSNVQHFSFLCPQNICPITSNHRRIDINQHCFRCFFPLNHATKNPRMSMILSTVSFRSPEEHLTSMLLESQSSVCNCNLVKRGMEQKG